MAEQAKTEEKTLWDLATRLEERTSSLKAHLEQAILTSVTKEFKSRQPSADKNILDEIIDVLTATNTQMAEIQRFVQAEILRKIK